MRKIVIAAVAVVVLVVVAMLLLPHFIDVNQYRGEIQAQLQDRLHRPVQLGACRWRSSRCGWKSRTSASAKIRVSTAPLPFAQVGEMDISVKLFPLLSKTIAIESLSLEAPADRTDQRPAGVWNFASLGEGPTPAAPPPPRRPPRQPHPGKQGRLRHQPSARRQLLAR